MGGVQQREGLLTVLDFADGYAGHDNSDGGSGQQISGAPEVAVRAEPTMGKEAGIGSGDGGQRQLR